MRASGSEGQDAVSALVVVNVDEDLDLMTEGRVSDRLQEALRLRPDRLVIDLSGCRFLDARGLRVLVRARATAERVGCDLTLRDPSPFATRLLRLTGLEGSLPIEPARP